MHFAANQEGHALCCRLAENGNRKASTTRKDMYFAAGSQRMETGKRRRQAGEEKIGMLTSD
jgi:hypothetical protein